MPKIQWTSYFLPRPLVPVLVSFFLLSCATAHPPREIVYPAPVVMPTATQSVKAPEHRSAQDSDDRMVNRSSSYPLPLYEKLTYDLKWMGVSVGTVTATIKGIVNYRGKEAYHLEVRTQSNSWLDKIYHIDSTYSSYMDVNTLTALEERVNRKEGRYRKDATVVYNQQAAKAYFHNKTDDSSFEFAIPEGVRDAVSSTYYFRTLALNVDDKVAFDVVVGEKNYKFKADVKNERTIRLNGFKPQDAVYIQPYVVFEDANAKKGSVAGYFSKESYHVPLYAVVQAPVFSKITIKLRDIDYSN